MPILLTCPSCISPLLPCLCTSLLVSPLACICPYTCLYLLATPTPCTHHFCTLLLISVPCFYQYLLIHPVCIHLTYSSHSLAYMYTHPPISMSSLQSVPVHTALHPPLAYTPEFPVPHKSSPHTPAFTVCLDCSLGLAWG